MRNYLNYVLVFSGVCVVVFGMYGGILDNQLKAISCSYRCTANNGFCQGNSVLPECGCDKNITGIIMSNSKTYGKDPGTKLTTNANVFCKANFYCESSPVNNHKCVSAYESGNLEHLCAVSVGDICYDRTVGPPVSLFMNSCVENECQEE